MERVRTQRRLGNQDSHQKLVRVRYFPPCVVVRKSTISSERGRSDNHRLIHVITVQYSTVRYCATCKGVGCHATVAQSVFCHWQSPRRTAVTSNLQHLHASVQQGYKNEHFGNLRLLPSRQARARTLPKSCALTSPTLRTFPCSAGG